MDADFKTSCLHHLRQKKLITLTNFIALLLQPLGEPGIIYLWKSVKICVPYIFITFRISRFLMRILIDERLIQPPSRGFPEAYRSAEGAFLLNRSKKNNQQYNPVNINDQQYALNRSAFQR